MPTPDTVNSQADKPKRGRPKKDKPLVDPATRSSKFGKPQKSHKVPIIDADAVLRQRNVNNLSITEIAKINGVHYSTIYRFLERMSHVMPVAQFRNKHADILSMTQAEILAVQGNLRADLLNENVVRQMTPEQKRAWHHTLSIERNMAHGQERLERGLSTSNALMIYASALEEVCKGAPQDVVIEGEASE